MELNAITRFNSYATLNKSAAEAWRRGGGKRRGGMKRRAPSKLRVSHSGDAKEKSSRELGAYNPWVERRVKHMSLKRLVHTFVNGMVRGGLTGYTLRIAFKLIPLLVATLRRGAWRQLPSRLRSLFINGVAEARFGLFVGGVMGSLRTALLLARYKGTRSARWGALAGGGMAALCVLLLPPASRTSMALFFLVRALEVIARHLAASGAVPTVEHADTLLMMGASAQVLWAWIFAPSTLDRSYVRFLNVHGGHPREVINMLGKAQLDRNNNIDWSQVVDFHAKLGRQVSSVPGLYNMACEIRHPGSSCTAHVSEFWYRGFLRAIKVYLPVHLLPLIIFGHKRLLSDPVGSAQHVVFGIARSSSFLASYCAAAWLALCLQRQFLGLQTQVVGFTCGMVGGAAVALEKKSRRVELALYVFSHALLALWNLVKKRGLIRPQPFGAAALFGAAVSVLLQAYMMAPSLLRPSYVSAVSWLLLWPKERHARPLSAALQGTSIGSPSVTKGARSSGPAGASGRLAFHQAAPGSVRRVGVSPSGELPVPPSAGGTRRRHRHHRQHHHRHRHHAGGEGGPAGRSSHVDGAAKPPLRDQRDASGAAGNTQA